ncbi:MAG: T9SS type A sorting domain-containing protein [Bacteroidota bacterium]
MRWVSFLAAGLLLSAVAPLPSAQTPPDATLLQPGADPFGEFARAVSVSGGTAVAGEARADQFEQFDNRGAVSIFERQPDGSWDLSQRFFASDSQEGDFNESPGFGAAVALSGDRLAVGAPGEQDGSDTNPAPGAVYIFERQADGSWAEVDKVRDPDPVRFGFFGEAVALDGDRMLVAAERGEDPATDYEGGTVYVFDRQSDGTWTASATLQRPEAEGRVGFGDALALDGDRALIGAGGTNFSPVNRNGRAYVYDLSGSTWTEVAELESPDGTVANNNKQFGEAVSLDGDVALIGARGQGIEVPGLGFFASGAAYVFAREASGEWTLRQRLDPDDLDRAELPSSRQIEFGRSVALEDGTAVVGASRDVVGGEFDAGSAYVFEDDEGTWTRTAKLRGGGREFSNFGFSMSVSDGTVVTGEIRGGDPDTEPGVAQVHVLVAPPPPTLSLTVREAIGVTDDPRLLAALQLLVQESIGVTDAPALVQALMLMVQERVGVSDGPTLAQADGSTATAAFPIRLDSTRVAFLGPVGLTVSFSGVEAEGGVSVFFEALAPEAPDGIPMEATLAPYRWRISATDGLAFDSARVAFDPDVLPRLFLSEGEEVAVYRRPDSGGGTFAALQTTLDPETGEIVASGVEAFSEFAIAGTGVIVGTEEEGPAVFGLSAPRPNPARGTTRLVLSLAEPGPAQVDVLDLRGRRVATLVQGELPAGQTVIDLRADTFAAGSYVVVLRAGGQLATSRLTVVR